MRFKLSFHSNVEMHILEKKFKTLSLIFLFGKCMKIMIIIKIDFCETFEYNIVNIMIVTFVSQQNKWHGIMAKAIDFHHRDKGQKIIANSKWSF
jgi:hypothetical protein